MSIRLLVLSVAFVRIVELECKLRYLLSSGRFILGL